MNQTLFISKKTCGFCLFILLLSTVSGTVCARSVENGIRKQLFDYDWKFALGDDTEASPKVMMIPNGVH